MTNFEILISGKTDPVPGKWDNPKDFADYFGFVNQSFPASYEIKAELVTIDHWMENTTPSTELEYLKSHSVHELLSRLRVWQSGEVLGWNDRLNMLDEAILVISALNAVKMVEEVPTAGS